MTYKKPFQPDNSSSKSNKESKVLTRKRTAQSSAKMKNYDFCAIKKECKSCLYVNEPYLKSVNLKHAHGVELLKSAQILENCHILPAVPSPMPLTYRSVAKLAVRPSQSQDDKFSIGLFQPGSHKVVDIRDCPLHIPAINQALRMIKAKLEASSITPWDEESMRGDLKYLIIRASHKTQELVITFVCAHDKLKSELKEIINKLKEQHRVFGAYINVNNTDGNAIYGKTTIKISGNDKLREHICDLRFDISPQSFFQVNPWQASNLYRRITQLVGNSSQNEIAWDLYSGIGPISMCLAKSHFKVISIEENPHAVKDAQQNIQINSLKNITPIIGRVEESFHEIPHWAQSPDVIVINPSRTGLAEHARIFLRDFLKKSPNTQFIYVSCDLGTFIRDLKVLQESGHRARQIESFDMFAQTDKLEWLAVLTR